MFMSRFVAFIQYALPKKLITKIADRVANAKNKWWLPALINWFVRKYDVQLHEAVEELVTGYISFNDFFTRALKDGARPIADATWVSPADGSISSCGRIEYGQIFQAKGSYFSAKALLGSNDTLANRFADGGYATIYLSPKDYHRVHMPINGRLLSMTYIPGEFFSVSHVAAQSIHNLFARNERVVTIFNTDPGLLAMVLVGAAIVGSVTTTWHGAVFGKKITHWDYSDSMITLDKGRFLLGSTVVMLMECQFMHFPDVNRPLHIIQMGNVLAIASGDRV
jgi:phosphatidylserine decarboxylase